MRSLESLFHVLVKFESTLWAAVDTRLRAECGLPVTWFEPMRAMSGRSPCRVIDLAEELEISVGGVSKLVDRIEASGYCSRRPIPGDLRSSDIALTVLGTRILCAATAALEDELHIQLGPAMAAAVQTAERFHHKRWEGSPRP